MIRTTLDIDSMSMSIVNGHDIAIYYLDKQEYLCTWHHDRWKILRVLHEWGGNTTVSCCIDVVQVEEGSTLEDMLYDAIRAVVYDITRYFYEFPQRNMRDNITTTLLHKFSKQLINEYNTYKPSTTTSADSSIPDERG